MSHGHALQIKNVTKRFGGHAGIVAVRDMSFDVKPGEFISIIGPSGCGKSTLFNVIGGFIKDYEGEVTLDGKGKPGDHTIGTVFQEESTFPWRTTLQNVMFPLEAAGMPKKERIERARHFIKLVGLEGFEDNYPSELSGGMRQRTAIARTLAFDPKILLMDEPFAALDEQTRLLLGDKVLQISAGARSDDASDHAQHHRSGPAFRPGGRNELPPRHSEAHCPDRPAAAAFVGDHEQRALRSTRRHDLERSARGGFARHAGSRAQTRILISLHGASACCLGQEGPCPLSATPRDFAPRDCRQSQR